MKVLVANPEKCTNCQLCMLACSFNKTSEFNPFRARLSIVGVPEDGFVQVVCRQCLKPSCREVCPVDAIDRDQNTGAMIIDYDLCIGCRECVDACPLGGMAIDPVDESVIKCDLCGGDPQCVKHCSYDALSYQDAFLYANEKRVPVAIKMAKEIEKQQAS